MKNILKDYFYYTRSERNGVLVLLFLVGIIFLLPSVFPYLLKKPMQEILEVASLPSAPAEKTSSPPPSDTTSTILFAFDPNTSSKKALMRLGLSPKIAQRVIKYREKVGRFAQKKDFSKIYGLTKKEYQRLETYIHIRPQEQRTLAANIPRAYDAPPSFIPSETFYFDPNILPKDSLRRLGLSPKVVNTILNFRKKGKFRKKSDFSKIIGLSKKDDKRLQPYIVLQERYQWRQKKEKKASKVAPKKIILDVNTASVEEWMELNGIGTKLSQRIIKFRDKLGGFSSIAQIGETYHLPDSTFQQIKSSLVHSPIFNKIKINAATLDELKAHPYIDYKKAKLLVNYQKQHGDFKSLEDVRKIHAFKEDFVAQIAPYLAY